MPKNSSFCRLRSVAMLCLALGSLLMAASGRGQPAAPVDKLTVIQLLQLGRQGETNDLQVVLEGVVCYENPAKKIIVLQDESGAATIECDPFPESVKAGQQIVLGGEFVGNKYTASLRIGGVLLRVSPEYGMNGKTATLTLTRGFYPFTVTCFNQNNLTDLGIYYAQSGVVRQRLPASALFHPEVDATTQRTNWLPGIHYRVFESASDPFMDFSQLQPVKTGLASGFDLGVRTRARDVGVEFTGFVYVPYDGSNSFYLDPANSGGVLLKLSRFNVSATSAVPQPRSLTLGQILPATDLSLWAEVEGVITFCGRRQSGTELVEIHSGTGDIYADLADDSGLSAQLLTGARVRMIGVCQGAYTLDNQLIPGRLSVAGEENLQVLEFSPELWKAISKVEIGHLYDTKSRPSSLVHLSGKISPTAFPGLERLEDPTGSVLIRFIQRPSPTPGTEVEILAQRAGNETNVALKGGVWRSIRNSDRAARELPLLTSVAQIKRLSRDDAVRGYPVKIAGVVTWSEQNAVVLQDATGSVFIDVMPTEYSYQKRVGELWEISGTTTARFSPMILCASAKRLGLGILPEPVRASGDQLKNGTLDTEFVEIEGAVISIQQKTIVLLTHNGRIKVNLPDADEDWLAKYKGAVIRIRGCLWAVKDEVTHLFEVSEVQIHNASIDLETPAPDDPFTVQAKRVRDLLLYDANARAFQQVRISGQIIHVRNGEYFLMDGTNGLRFSLRTNQVVNLGDLVEVVGYPDLGGISPVLHDAVIRITGHSALPQPRMLNAQTVVEPEYDSTLVKVDGKLVNLSQESDAILTLQAGSRFFRARCHRGFAGQLDFPIGSQLEVTGVFAGQGGSIINGRTVESFELLINSPGDIRVLARPPWWTLKRVLMVLLMLSGILILSISWIAVLHRKVEQRSTQLKIEIQARQESEFKNAIECERSRIARDLHDELGASVTEISMVADAGAGPTLTLEKSRERFDVIAQKSREMVGSLDTIVWLVNPRKDFLPHFAAYLGSFAQEFLGEAGINCRLAFQPDIPTIQLGTEMRHNLFLATKEVLTNVARHARATKAEVGLAMVGRELHIWVSDNGQGFELTRPSNRNGLANLKGRLETIGGRCEVTSAPGQGTKILLSLPLPPDDHSATSHL